MTSALPPERRARRRWRLSPLAAVIAVLSVLGASVALYPSTASWFTSIQEAQRIATYGDAVKVLGPASRTAALKQAHAYNAALQSGAAVKADERIPVATGATLPSGFDYDRLLAADPYGLMGRIAIPSIGADLPIYHGTSDATLAEGVGHLEGSSLPVGGPGTHAVLAGHRGLASATLFTNLDKVVDGDTFSLYIFGEPLTYRVFDIKVVDPDQTKTLAPVPGKDLVTLVTCTPIGINSQRILVTGERVTPAPQTAVAAGAESPIGPGFPWWAVALTATVAAAAAYVWWSGRSVQRRRRATAAPRGVSKSTRRVRRPRAARG